MRNYELHQKLIRIGDVVTDSDAIKSPLWKPDHAIKITAVKLGANVACNKADTNYNTFKLTDGTNTIASIANGPDSEAGQSFAVGAFYDMTVDKTYQEVAKDTQLKFEVTKTGSGLALTGTFMQIDYYDNNA